MQKKVLLVEDYEDSRLMMKHIIESEGYVVIEAAGAYEAIEKAGEHEPDLILMDIGLPLLDGLSTASIIHGNSALGEIPIVVVTAFNDIADEAQKAGCAGVLYKPIEPSKLKLILDFHLASSLAT